MGDIKKIMLVEAQRIINNGKPLGKFITFDGNSKKYIGIDNQTEDSWTEEFDTKQGCIAWLNGEDIETSIYKETALKIGNIVQTKNNQYGNAINNTGEFLKLLYPNGIKQEQYAELGVIVRVYDKLKRIANGNQGEENAWQDIAGYGILMCGGEKK